MIYVDVYASVGNKTTEHKFNTPYNALRFMYLMKEKGYIIAGYRCDDPYDKKWLDCRWKY